MSSFPLFRLPLVPIRSILNMMDLLDKVRLFMSSKKTYQLLKATGKSAAVESLLEEQDGNLGILDMIDLLRLKIYFDSQETFEKYRPSLTIEISDDMKFNFNVNLQSTWIVFNIDVEPEHRQSRCHGTNGNLKFGYATIPVVIKNGYHIYTFWENKLKGFQTIGNWFKQYFKPIINIRVIEGKEYNFSVYLRFIVNWINSDPQQTVKNCNVITGDALKDEDLKFVVDNVQATNSLMLTTGNWDPGFHYNPHIKTNVLSLGSAYWFRLRNLSMLECRDIRISDSRLTNEDFIEYLKQWLTGRFPILSHLDVHTRKKLDFDHIISGLASYQVRVDGRLEKHTLTREDGSFSLKRNDGMIAKILTPRRMYAFDMRVSNDSISC